MRTTPAREVVRGKADMRVSGAYVPHAVDLLRLASATERDGDAEACSALPERVTARVVRLSLALQAHAEHTTLLYPI
jgi:hypothetical protein